MREVFSDFTIIDRHRSDGTVRVWLGGERSRSDLEGLTDGVPVRVVMPGELMAEGIAESERINGMTGWYAVVSSWDDIKDISPGDMPPVHIAPITDGTRRIPVDFSLVMQHVAHGKHVGLGTDRDVWVPGLQEGERVIAYDAEMRVEGVVVREGAFWLAELDWDTRQRSVATT